MVKEKLNWRMKKGVNFRIVFDGIFSSIEKTTDEVDNEHVFFTFKKAKASLIDFHKKRIEELRDAIQHLKELNENSITDLKNEQE
jgi:gas vesicle protein